MAILKKKLESNFTVINNGIFKDPRLNLKARGLLCTMLSLPDSWEFSENGLGAILQDGQTAIRSAIKTLTEAGYLKREQIRDGGKFTGWEWTISDRPIFLESPYFENHNSENTNSENQPQLRTKQENKKQLRTELTNELTNNGKPQKIIPKESPEVSIEDAETFMAQLSMKCKKYKGMADSKTQAKYGKQSLEKIMLRTGCTLADISLAIDGFLQFNPRMRQKSPSYLLLDCEEDIVERIVEAKNGVSWSKW